MAKTESGFLVLTGPFQLFATAAKAQAAAMESCDSTGTAHVVLQATVFRPVKKSPAKAPATEE